VAQRREESRGARGFEDGNKQQVTETPHRDVRRIKRNRGNRGKTKRKKNEA